MRVIDAALLFQILSYVRLIGRDASPLSLHPPFKTIAKRDWRRDHGLLPCLRWRWSGGSGGGVRRFETGLRWRAPFP